MFGWSKRERTDREIKEMTTWILDQSVVQGSNFPPEEVFGSRLQMQVALEACGFFLHAVDGGGGQRWTAAARLEAVIATAAMDEAARSAWCRERAWRLGPSPAVHLAMRTQHAMET